MANRTCRGCAADLTGMPKRQVWCSKKCRDSAWHRQYREANGEWHSSVSRRRTGAGTKRHPIACEHCGAEGLVTKKDARFCSYACSTQARTIRTPPQSRRRYLAGLRLDQAAKGTKDLTPRYVDSSGCVHRRLPGRQKWKITKARRLAIYERDDWTCQLCGEAVDPTLNPLDLWAATLDHITPRSHGGDHADENLRLAHRWCNSIRGDERHYTADDLRIA